MPIFHKYRGFCGNESLVVESDFRLEDQGPPLYCPNSNTHTIPASDWTIIESYIDIIPVVTQADGATAVGIDLLQHPPGWTYLCIGFDIEIPEDQTTRCVEYRQVLDGAGSPMDFRAWTGKCIPHNCNVLDKITIELVVKGSALGGVDDTNDLVLDQFLRDLRPINGIMRNFTPPDKSLLLPADANDLNPALPNTGLFFKVTYTPGTTALADQHLIFDLEGFEPPAS